MIFVRKINHLGRAFALPNQVLSLTLVALSQGTAVIGHLMSVKVVLARRMVAERFFLLRKSEDLALELELFLREGRAVRQSELLSLLCIILHIDVLEVCILRQGPLAKAESIFDVLRPRTQQQWLRVLCFQVVA